MKKQKPKKVKKNTPSPYGPPAGFQIVRKAQKKKGFIPNPYGPPTGRMG